MTDPNEGVRERPVFRQYIAVTIASFSRVILPWDFDFQLTYYNTDTVNSMTITVIDSDGQQADYAIAAGGNDVVKYAHGRIVAVSGVSTTVFSLAISWPGEVGPAALKAATIATVMITGTVSTDIGQRGNTLLGTNPVAILSGTNVIGAVKTVGDQTLQAQAQFNGDVAQQAEAVVSTSTSTVAVGGRVYFNLDCEGGGTIGAAANQKIYIAVKGHTTGIYYAKASLGTTKNGEFFCLGNEVLDIVVQNSDANTRQMAGYYQATGP